MATPRRDRIASRQDLADNFENLSAGSTLHKNQASKKLKKLTFLLIGKTGEGKSATGNTLLGRKEFHESASTQSVTKEVADGYVEYGEYQIKVVDSPGLADTQMTKIQGAEKAIQDMTDTIISCNGGVDAFLLIIRFPKRFTREEIKTFKSLKTIFGQDYFEYVIVVVTGGDTYEEDVDFKTWCMQQPGEFEEMYRAFKGRFVLFNNREKDQQHKREQIHKIIEQVHFIQTRQGTYTSEAFEKAKYLREKAIVEMKAPQLKEEIQAKINILSADLKQFIENQSSINKEDIERRIETLEKEIEIQDKGYNVLGDLQATVEQVRQNLGDAEQLHKLARELEMIRGGKISVGGMGITFTVVGGITMFTCPPLAAGYLLYGVTGGALWKSFKNDEQAAVEKINEIEKRLK